MLDSSVKIAAIIPAHLDSVRFKRKVLYNIFGFPMIEHVRRRATLSKKIDYVAVATGDQEIADVVKNYGGNVVMTSKQHLNGSSRVAEASENLDASHVILLQGDEPLLLPDYIDQMIDAIVKEPENDSWNGTGPIEKKEQLDLNSHVKCAINDQHKIMYCFRRSPSHADYTQQIKYIRKVLGIIAFRKEFLAKYASLEPKTIEVCESIEQMRVLEHGYNLTSVPFAASLPSINEPGDEAAVIQLAKADSKQREIFIRAFGVEPS